MIRTFKNRKMRQLANLREAAIRDRNEKRFYDDLYEALDKKEILPSEFSIRGLFENFVDGGREIVDSWNPDHGGGGISLLEATGAAGSIDTTAFSNITGQIVYQTVIQEWESPAFIGDQISTTVQTPFNGEKIPGVSGIGDVSASIGEGQPYPEAGVSEEWITTPQTQKRGFLVNATKESVFFDRTGLVLQRAGEVTRWLGLNKEKRIIDAAAGITTSYSRNGASPIATYQTSSPFINVKTSNGLVDWTNIEAAELLFDGMTDPNTGEQIVVMGTDIMVPTALRRTAERILHAISVVMAAGGYPTSGNPMRTESAAPKMGYGIITSPLVKARTGSATTWFFGDFKRAIEYRQNWPIEAAVAPPNSHLEFTQDIIFQSKVSERGVAAVVEPRRVTKSTA